VKTSELTIHRVFTTVHPLLKLPFSGELVLRNLKDDESAILIGKNFME